MIKKFEQFDFKDEDFDYEEEDLYFWNNDKNLKKSIIDELIKDGYSKEESIEQVDNATISLFNDVVSVRYDNGVIDRWTIDNNKLTNHF